MIFKKDRDETLIAFDKEARRRKVEDLKNSIIDGTKAVVDFTVDITKKAANWMVEHPVETIGIASMVIGGIYKGGRLITRNREIRHEQYIADCRFYDPRIGEYVFSDRKLSNDEKLRFNKLYQEGYSKREALNIMGRIKF